jgi:hypothetical protein
MTFAIVVICLWGDINGCFKLVVANGDSPNDIQMI